MAMYKGMGRFYSDSSMSDAAPHPVTFVQYSQVLCATNLQSTSVIYHTQFFETCHKWKCVSGIPGNIHNRPLPSVLSDS